MRAATGDIMCDHMQGLRQTSARVRISSDVIYDMVGGRADTEADGEYDFEMQ